MLFRSRDSFQMKVIACPGVHRAYGCPKDSRGEPPKARSEARRHGHVRLRCISVPAHVDRDTYDRHGPFDDLPPRCAGQVPVTRALGKPRDCLAPNRPRTMERRTPDGRSLNRVWQMPRQRRAATHNAVVRLAAPLNGLCRQHQLHDRADEQQRSHNMPPTPGREPVAMIHPERSMQLTHRT